jgi:hypothetical protein
MHYNVNTRKMEIPKKKRITKAIIKATTMLMNHARIDLIHPTS